MIFKLNIRKIIFITVTLIFFVATLPMLRYAVPVPGFGAMKEITVFFALIYLIFYIKNKKIVLFRNDSTITIMLLYIIYISIHIFITHASTTSALLMFKYHLLYALFAYSFYKIFKYHYLNGDIDLEIAIRKIFKAIVYVGILVITIGLYEKFIDPVFIKSLYRGATIHTYYAGDEFARVVSTIGNPIMLGYYLIIVSLISLFLLRNKMIHKIIVIYVILSSLILILFTLSRASYLIVCAIMIAYFFLTLNKNNFLIRSLFIFIMGVIAVYYIDFNNLLVIDNVMSRFEQLDSSEVGRDGRLVTWARSFDEFQTNIYVLFFGFGLGKLGWDDGTFVMENGYLAIIYEFGLIGFLLYCSVLLKFYLNIYKLKKSIYLYDRELALLLSLFLLFFLISMLVSDSHMGIPQVFYFWLFYIISELFYLRGKYFARTN